MQCAQCLQEIEPGDFYYRSEDNRIAYFLGDDNCFCSSNCVLDYLDMEYASNDEEE